MQLKHRLCYCQYTHRRLRGNEKLSRRCFSPPNTRTRKQRCSNHVLRCPWEVQAQHLWDSPRYQEKEICLFHHLSCRRSHYQGSLASELLWVTNSGLWALFPLTMIQHFCDFTCISVSWPSQHLSDVLSVAIFARLTVYNRGQLEKPKVMALKVQQLTNKILSRTLGGCLLGRFKLPSWTGIIKWGMCFYLTEMQSIDLSIHRYYIYVCMYTYLHKCNHTHCCLYSKDKSCIKFFHRLVKSDWKYITRYSQ